MWYNIIEEKEKKKNEKEVIVLFIEEKTFFFYSFFKKKNNNYTKQPMWNECDFLNVLKFEQKKTKNTFFPLQSMNIPNIFFILTAVAWVFI